MALDRGSAGAGTLPEWVAGVARPSCATAPATGSCGGFSGVMGRGAVSGSVKSLLAVRRLASHFLGATEGTQIEGGFSRRKIKARTFHRWFSIGVAFVPESFMRFGGG